MKERIFSVFTIVLVVLSMTSVLASCGKKDDDTKSLSSILEMNSSEYNIGVPLGSASDVQVKEKFDKVQLSTFNSFADMGEALSKKKIDALAYVPEVLLDMKRNLTGWTISNESIGDIDVCVGVTNKKPELTKKVNAFIKKCEADGTLSDMKNRWVTEHDFEMPKIEEPKNPEGTLVCATSGIAVPFSFYQDNELVGYDIELIKRFAKENNYKLKFEVMMYDAIVAALETGKVDVGAAFLNYTEERAKQITFSNPYYKTYTTFMYKDGLISESGRNNEKRVNESTIGAMTGSTGEAFVNSTYKDATLKNFTSIADGFAALENNKLDYVITSKSTALNYIRYNPVFYLAKNNVYAAGASIALNKEKSELRDKVDNLLSEYKKSGKLDEIIGHWIKEDTNEPYDFVKVKEVSDGETLSVAICANREPMCYIKDNEYYGLDVEIIRNIAYDLGYKIKFVNMDFSALIASIQSGKTDLAISNITNTEERAKLVDFTQDYFDNPDVIVGLNDKSGQLQYSSLSEMEGKTASILTGSVFDKAVEGYFGKDKLDFEYFNSVNDQVTALKSGKVDACVFDDPVARYVKTSVSGVDYIKEFLSDNHYGIISSLDNKELIEKLDKTIKEMNDSGKIDELQKKWFDSEKGTQKLDELEFSGENGELVLACDSGSGEPFTFVQDGEMVGYEVEIIRYFCSMNGYTLKIKDMTFNALIPCVQSKKADFAACCITITDERKEQVLFSDPTYSGGVVMLVNTKSDGSVDSSFIDSTIQSFKRTFITEKRYKLVLNGLMLTVLITVFAALLGTFLGFLLSFATRSKLKLLRTPFRAFISLIQGTPIVVILMILYYIIFGSVDITPIIVAIIGFGIDFGCSVSGMLNTGISTVDKGEIEAAYSMGMSKLQIFTKITLPQATRKMIGVYSSNFIAMLKMTSIVGYIAIQDLTKASDIIRSRTYEAFFPLIATALIYFIMAFLLTRTLKIIEKKLDPKRKRKKLKGVQLHD